MYGLYRSVCIRGAAVGGFPNPDTVYRASLSALLVMYVDRDVCSIASTRNFYNVMYGRSCGCTTFRTFTAYWQLLHTAQTHCYLRFMEYRLKVTSPPRNYPKIGYIRHEVPPTRDSQDVPFFFSETRRLRLAPRRAPKTRRGARGSRTTRTTTTTMRTLRRRSREKAIPATRKEKKECGRKRVNADRTTKGNAE